MEKPPLPTVGDPTGWVHVRKVLVVDDDARFMAALLAILAELEVEVDICSGPILPALRTTSAPELVLLNVKLESTDAFALIRTQIPPDFRGVVSVMSGLGLEIIAEVMLFGEGHGLSMGAPLLKPVSPREVRHVVEAADQLLERRSVLELEKGRPAAALTRTPLRLREALEAGQLEVWYQPKFDLDSGEVVGAEALIRGRRRDGSVVTPYELLSGATREDKAALTDFLLSTALGHAERLASEGFRKRLSFNVPISYLLQPDPVRLVRQGSCEPWWPGMVFEITEDEVLGDTKQLQAVATQLRLYGIVLSIDDFGAAYSSLERLRDLPFEELKLDRSFVHGCAADSTKGSICKSVIELGAELGVTTVAEGVEDAADLELISELGCNQVQGYLFAKPMTFTDLCNFVRSRLEVRLVSDQHERLCQE